MTLPADVTVTVLANGNKQYRRGTLALTIPPTDSAAYTVDSISVPPHGWFQQWTERIVQPTIIKSPADLVAANRVFLYGPVPGTTPVAVKPRTYLGPFDNAGLVKTMTTTGERPEIGLITDCTAVWLLGGSPDSMFAQAFAADSVPIQYVDETTGKPFDKVAHPQGNCYSTANIQGLPWWPRGPKDPTTGNYQFSNGWHPDPSHYPSLSYVAFEATHDISFLYNLQHAANLPPILDAAKCSVANGAVINAYSNFRQFAWGIRSLFEAHIATSDAEALGILPADLHPSSYFKKLLDNNLAFYLPQISDPQRQLFRQLGPLERFNNWEFDYLLTALGFGILTGHSDWLPIYVWMLGNVIERTKGGSYQQNAYPTGWGVSYYLNAYEWVKNPDGTYNTAKFDYTKPLNWWTAFLFLQNDKAATPPTQAQITALMADPLHGGVAFVGNEYNMTQRAVLIQADYLEKKGLANIRGAYPNFDQCLANANALVKSYGLLNQRQSVISIPATGGIHMGKPVTVNVNQKLSVPFTYDDGAGHPSQPPTGMAAVSQPAGLVSATVTVNPDGTGTVDVVGLVAGNGTLTLTGQGAVSLSDSAPLSVSVPLAGALHLNP